LGQEKRRRKKEKKKEIRVGWEGVGWLKGRKKASSLFKVLITRELCSGLGLLQVLCLCLLLLPSLDAGSVGRQVLVSDRLLTPLELPRLLVDK